MRVKGFEKFWVAVVAALTVAGQVLADGELTAADIGLIATAVAGALGVRAKGNS